MAADGERRDDYNVEAIVDWLVEGCPTAKSPQEVLFQLCQQLSEAGLPLHRVAVFVTTLHPNVMGRGFFWRRGDKEAQVAEAPYSVIDSDEYQRNPIARVFVDGEVVRRRICEPDCPRDFLILDQLEGERVTDYVAMPLRFTSGQIHAVTWTTDVPGGFTDGALRALHRVQPALARLAEVLALRRTAGNLLDAYLGHQAGQKVLSGQIKRGDGQDIFAVIWFCDLRGSTPLAESMSRGEFLELLNDYFECMADPVLDHGGQVLRFIGDAALAIFPISDEDFTMADACTAAVAAAQDARARMAALNEEREAAGKPRIGFGIGLHLGDVMYGNIGTKSRIEFSVIGSAANEAARIESQCKELGVDFLASSAVAEHAAGDWRSLGRHALRGVGQEIEILTLA